MSCCVNGVTRHPTPSKCSIPVSHYYKLSLLFQVFDPDRILHKSKKMKHIVKFHFIFVIWSLTKTWWYFSSLKLEISWFFTQISHWICPLQLLEPTGISFDLHQHTLSTLPMTLINQRLRVCPSSEHMPLPRHLLFLLLGWLWDLQAS